MLATIYSDLIIVAAVLLVVGVICAPVRNDHFQQRLGLACLIIGVMVGAFALYSQSQAEDAPAKQRSALQP